MAVCLTLGSSAQLSAADVFHALVGLITLAALAALLAAVIPVFPALARWLSNTDLAQGILSGFNQSLMLLITANLVLGLLFLLLRLIRALVRGLI